MENRLIEIQDLQVGDEIMISCQSFFKYLKVPTNFFLLFQSFGLGEFQCNESSRMKCISSSKAFLTDTIK